MNAVAKSALDHVYREIAKRYRAGWTSENRPIKVLVAKHDRILARWPNAYMKS